MPNSEANGTGGFPHQATLLGSAERTLPPSGSKSLARGLTEGGRRHLNCRTADRSLSLDRSCYLDPMMDLMRGNGDDGIVSLKRLANSASQEKLRWALGRCYLKPPPLVGESTSRTCRRRCCLQGVINASLDLGHELSICSINLDPTTLG